MGLSVGIKLGSHEIVSPLGAGGMGEVYRSRYGVRRDLAVKDLTLNRSTHGPQTGFEEITGESSNETSGQRQSLRSLVATAAP